MLQNFLNYTVRGRVQRNGATLLALSTVAMGGVEPGTMVIAARERGEPPLQDTYLHDLTRVFRPGDGRFPFLYGRTPCVKIDAAAAAAAHFNVGPEANAREGDPDRRINLVWRAYQCTAGTRVQGGPGSDDRPTSWEVGAIIKAWEDRGPASIAGVVVDTYDADGAATRGRWSRAPSTRSTLAVPPKRRRKTIDSDARPSGTWLPGATSSSPFRIIPLRTTASRKDSTST